MGFVVALVLMLAGAFVAWLCCTLRDIYKDRHSH